MLNLLISNNDHVVEIHSHFTKDIVLTLIQKVIRMFDQLDVIYSTQYLINKILKIITFLSFSKGFYINIEN
jgi:hypothetical protein